MDIIVFIFYLKFYSNETKSQRKLIARKPKTRGDKTRKRKQRTLHEFYKTGAVSPNFGKHVSGLVTRAANMTD